MVEGYFAQDIPFIRVDLAWGDSIQSPLTVLDTGFTGDLQVTPAIAQELGLQVAGVIQTQVASGDVVEMPIALAVAGMEGISRYVQILISNSMPLAGIGLLSKFSYKAVVDCRKKTVQLERV